MGYIYKAGVVGAGTMGSGIAQLLTYANLPVVLKEENEEALEKGVSRIRKTYQKRVEKGKMTPQELDLKMALIHPTITYDAFHDVDLVIEAVPEKADLKRAFPHSIVYRDDFGHFALQAHQLGEAAVPLQQLIVGPHLHDPPRL